MSIVIGHERNHTVDAALAFLIAQQQAAQQRAAQQPQVQIPTYQELVAMSQAQQPPAAAGVPSGPGGGGGGSAYPRGGTSAPAEPQQRSGLRPNLAGLRFIEQQNQIAAGFANQQNQALHDQALTDRQLQVQQMEMQQQAQNAAAIDMRQQLMAEEQANLQQRNKLMQTAPGVIDPDTLMGTQARVQSNRELLTYPARQARQKLLESIATGDPEAIQEGLRQGLLQFSPEQQTRIRQLREAMAQVDLDPSLSPAQRAIASRSLAEKLNAIRPMEVPSDQQPKDPLEQYHEGTITYPHETSGIPITKQRVIRNGEEKWELTDESKEDLKIWGDKEVKKWEQQNGYGANDPEIKRQEHEFKQKEQAIKLYTQLQSAKMETQKQLNDLRLSLLDAKKSLAVAAATADGGVDDAEAQAEIDRLMLETHAHEANIQRYDMMMPDLNIFGGMSSTGAPGQAMGGDTGMGSFGAQVPPQPAASSGPPAWYTALPSGATYTAPDGTQRIKP